MKHFIKYLIVGMFLALGTLSINAQDWSNDTIVRPGKTHIKNNLQVNGDVKVHGAIIGGITIDQDLINTAVEEYLTTHEIETDSVWITATADTGYFEVIIFGGTNLQDILDSKLESEVDGSVTNELQTLIIDGYNITITDGNTVPLPQSTGNGFSIDTIQLLPSWLNTGGVVSLLNISFKRSIYHYDFYWGGNGDGATNAGTDSIKVFTHTLTDSFKVIGLKDEFIEKNWSGDISVTPIVSKWAGFDTDSTYYSIWAPSDYSGATDTLNCIIKY